MTLAVLGNLLIAVGGLVFAVGALGLVRMPDFYARLSALGMSGGLAVILVLLGALAHFPTWGNAALALLAVVIQLATAGVGGGAMARAAYLTGVRRSPRTHWDEIATTDPSHADPSHTDPSGPRPPHPGSRPPA